jgi:amino-acid N-acetyltransferase
MIRKALPQDIPQIRNFLREFNEKWLLVPRTMADLYSQVRDYFIIHDIYGPFQIAGVAALHVCWENTGEIRSLAVHEKYQKQGMGKALLMACLDEAWDLGLKNIFILTRIPDYFERILFAPKTTMVDVKFMSEVELKNPVEIRRFHRISRDQLPPVAWADCVGCPRFPDCDEIPMMLELY